MTRGKVYRWGSGMFGTVLGRNKRASIGPYPHLQKEEARQQSNQRQTRNNQPLTVTVATTQ